VFREVAAAVPDPLALQLVTDEEVGGRDGTGHQLGQGVTAAFVVIGEHSRLDVVADSKGLAHVRLAAAGRSGHGAYPWLADNAAVKLLTTVHRLLEHYPVPAAHAWRTTVNVARLDTPNRAFNQVPAAAEAWLDIRFTAGDTDLGGRTPQEVAAFLSRFCEPGVAVGIDNLAAPHHAAHDGVDVAALRRAAQAEGYPGEFLYKHGSGDGGFYSARGIPAVAFGVGGDGQHGPHEYAEIDTIGPYHRALTRFLTGLPPDPARGPTGPSHPRRPA
jgi:succinyl-diaminopimelate desuccinylase